MQLEVLKEYYGKHLKSSKDLKTLDCCDGVNLPPHLQPLLSNLHPVASRLPTCRASSWRQVLGALAAAALGHWLFAAEERVL